MKYGYARVSTDDQTPALQLAELKRGGCNKTFVDDGRSGTTLDRYLSVWVFLAMWAGIAIGSLF